MTRISFYWAPVLLLSFASTAAAQSNKPLAPIEDQKGLKRILLLGDSISIGYTLPVRTLLKGQVNLHRAPANCGPTTRGLEQLDRWLGDKPWDVIHFNFGLHDLKYLGSQGSLASPTAAGSRQQVPPDQYRKNLAEIVKRLQQTKARLIWCSTTPVPAGAKGRVEGDAAKYNRIAEDVMKEAGVEIHDLFALAKPQLTKLQRPENVHFTPQGSMLLAKQVASLIKQALSR